MHDWTKAQFPVGEQNVIYQKMKGFKLNEKVLNCDAKYEFLFFSIAILRLTIFFPCYLQVMTTQPHAEEDITGSSH